MIYRWFTLLILLCFFATGVTAQSGLLMKLQLMPDDLTWGVYVEMADGIVPSDETLTASGQVTVVMPYDFQFIGPFDANGQWVNNATVVSPTENTQRKYVSFGLVQAEPLYPIIYEEGEEVLLFTFEASSCPDTLFLIDCNSADGVTDPFCPDYPDSTPFANSENSNPGNELSVLDFGNNFEFYGYERNYALSAWSCHDCDADGIPNAWEDTNGNGMYDPDEDVSNLCDFDGCTVPDWANLYQVPGTESICPGDEAKLFVDIEGGTGPYTLTISDGAQTFTIENYESGSPIPVSPTATTEYFITAVATSDDCAIDPANTDGLATVTVENTVSISAVPANALACEGETASFTASALNNGEGIVYAQWQRSCDNGATWEAIGQVAETTDATLESELTVPDVSANEAGCQYRFHAWTAQCGEAFSGTALLSLGQSLEVAQQPASQTVCFGEGVSFNAVISGAAGLNYQWQQRCTDSDWEDISASDPAYEGAQTPTLEVLESNSVNIFCEYRLRATAGTCGETVTEAVAIVAETPAVITAQPSDFTVCPGSIVQFTAEATAGGSVHYQWQLAAVGQNYIDIPGPNPLDFEGFKTPTLSVNTIVPSMNGFKFRLAVTTENCTERVYSEPASLDIPQNIFIAQSPESQLVCDGSTVEITTEVDESGQSNVTYQWQQQLPGSTDWSNLNDDSNFDGTATETLQIASSSGLGGSTYRLQATGICQTVTSNAAELALENPTVIVSQPSDYVGCPGEVSQLTAEVEAGSSASYWWEMSIGGQDYQPLPSDFVGWNTATLNVDPLWQTSAQQLQFRLRVINEVCGASVVSESAGIGVLPVVEVLASPENQTDCSGNPAYFFADIDEAGQSSVTYQWQQRPFGSTDWENLTDDATFSGTATEELYLSSNSGLDGTAYRLQATGTCQTVATEAAFLVAEECFVDSGFVDMKLKLLPGGDGWGVWIRPSENYIPHPYTTATSGRVVIGVSAGFSFHNLTSHAAGTWKPGTVLLEGPSNPNHRYFTFNLTPNNNQLLLEGGKEIMLFAFKNAGACPEDMFILEGPVPTGLQACTFSGVELDGDPFFLKNIYDHDAWDCNPGGQGLMADNSPNTAVANGANLENDTPAPATSVGIESQPALGNQQSISELRLSPNPAGDFVNVSLGTINGAGEAILHLLNLQGQTILMMDVAEQTDLQLQLGSLPVGLYFIVLEEDGKVVQREKLVKK